MCAAKGHVRFTRTKCINCAVTSTSFGARSDPVTMYRGGSRRNNRNVRFGSKPDICAAKTDVRFNSESRHSAVQMGCRLRSITPIIRLRSSGVCEGASASRHGQAFGPDRTPQTHTYPMVFPLVLFQGFHPGIPLPRCPHLPCRNKVRTDFCPGQANPRLLLSNEADRCRWSAFDRSETLLKLNFQCA